MTQRTDGWDLSERVDYGLSEDDHVVIIKMLDAAFHVLHKIFGRKKNVDINGEEYTF